MEFCIPPTILDCIPLIAIMLSSPPRMAEAHPLTVFLTPHRIELADALSVIVFSHPQPMNDICIVFVDPVIVLLCPPTILDPNGTPCDHHHILFQPPHTIFALDASIVFEYHQTMLLLLAAQCGIN